jgi:hypothetical protein
VLVHNYVIYFTCGMVPISTIEEKTDAIGSKPVRVLEPYNLWKAKAVALGRCRWLDWPSLSRTIIL